MLACDPARVRGTVGLDVSENKHANTLVQQEARRTLHTSPVVVRIFLLHDS